MFFFGKAVEIGGEADHGFNFFFTVAEVVVRYCGNDASGGVATGDFECAAIVVEFVLSQHIPSRFGVRSLPRLGEAQFLVVPMR